MVHRIVSQRLHYQTADTYFDDSKVVQHFIELFGHDNVLFGFTLQGSQHVTGCQFVFIKNAMVKQAISDCCNQGQLALSLA